MKQEIKAPPSPPQAVSGFCPVHPHNSAVGLCSRCQQPFCDVCEVRWHKDSLCLACFTRIMENQEATPGDLVTQGREGNISLVLAIIGWLLFLGSFWMFWTITGGSATKESAIINLIIFLVSFIAPLMSLGLALATLRSRGQGQKTALWGLVLSSLQVGVTLSLIVLNITHN